jgi:hypothetical protein
VRQEAEKGLHDELGETFGVRQLIQPGAYSRSTLGILLVLS